MILIEHCINCKNHQWSTRHNEARYKQLAQQFEHSFKQLGYKVDFNQKPRLGSFEISLEGFVLFSKLETGQFPDVNSVVKFVDDFSRATDKYGKYQQIKVKKGKGNQLRQSKRGRSILPIRTTRELSFSPSYHRSKAQQYQKTNNMINVLSHTRRQASLIGSKTHSIYNPSQTVRSNFFVNKFNQTDPSQWKKIKNIQLQQSKDSFQHSNQSEFIHKQDNIIVDLQNPKPNHKQLQQQQSLNINPLTSQKVQTPHNQRKDILIQDQLNLQMNPQELKEQTKQQKQNIIKQQEKTVNNPTQIIQ